MARGRRRGPSLLIPMIVLVLATMGVIYWATEVAHELDTKKQELAQAQVGLYTTKVREDEAAVRLEQSTEYLGYRGAGSLASPMAIATALEGVRRRAINYFDVDPESSQGRLNLRTGGRLTMADTVSFANDESLVSIIARQDTLINWLLDANRNLLLAAHNTRGRSDTGYREQVEAVERAERIRDTAIRHAISGDPANPYDPESTDSVPSLLEAIRETDARAGDVSRNEHEILDLYRRLWSPETSDLPDTLRELREQRRQVARLREQIKQETEQLAQALFETLEARREIDHYDGEVWWVDMERRRAYINLGQRDNVKVGMTFEIERVRGTENPLQLGMLTVRNVIGDFTAECEITLLRDEAGVVLPRDKVISRTFMRGIQPRFALVGQFGGDASRYSRSETEAMLREAGYTVDSELSRHTNIIVLGVGFRDDPQYERLGDRGDLNQFEHIYEYWIPAQVYYLLGFGD